MAVRTDLDAAGDDFIGPSRLAWRGAHGWCNDGRVWPASNSRLDAWISLLHTLGLDPAPLLMSTLCADFEGDQWSAVSVDPADAWACYAIAIQELVVWRPLLAHVVSQLDRGNAIVCEVDGFHLAGDPPSYQREHHKTVIIATGYDRRSHSLRYLHGASEGRVEGEDLDALLTAGIGSAQLPPFAQVVRLERLAARSVAERSVLGVALARLHGTRIPDRNPFRAFADAMREHGAWLAGGGDDHFRKWAFATTQQCGAAFELASLVTAWLHSHGEPVGAAVAPLRQASVGVRALHQRLARVPHAGRMPDVNDTMAECADAWDAAMTVLRPRYGA